MRQSWRRTHQYSSSTAMPFWARLWSRKAGTCRRSRCRRRCARKRQSPCTGSMLDLLITNAGSARPRDGQPWRVHAQHGQLLHEQADPIDCAERCAHHRQPVDQHHAARQARHVPQARNVVRAIREQASRLSVWRQGRPLQDSLPRRRPLSPTPPRCHPWPTGASGRSWSTTAYWPTGRSRTTPARPAAGQVSTGATGRASASRRLHRGCD